MKVFIIISLIMFNSPNSDAKFSPSSRKKIAPTIQAISEVTSELFVRHKIDFDFIILGKASGTLSYTIDQMIKEQENIRQVYQLKELRDWMGKAALVIVTNLSHLKKFLSQHADVRPKLLLFVPKILNFVESNLTLQNTGNFFLFEYNSRIELKTFTKWTPQDCDSKTFTSLNAYNKTSKNWQKPLRIPEKFSNFHGCPLNIYLNVIELPTFEMLIDSGIPLSFFHPDLPKSLGLRDSRNKEILDLFAEQGNFTIILNKNRFDSKKLDTVVLTRNTEHQNIHDEVERYSCSYGVFQYFVQVLYSPPEPYTNYEKMLLPFDHDTWMFLILIFCFSFVGIFIINLTPPAFRDLVYGRNVNMPSFNVISIIFGMGQTRLPENHFGRILLMSFVLFCLIFRTAYQGVFFEMFTSDMRRPAPETFADLKQRNYTYYDVQTEHFTSDFFFKYLQPHERPNQANLTMFEAFDAFKKLQLPNATLLKIAIPTCEADLKVIRSGCVGLPKTLKQTFYFPPISICTDERNFFTRSSVKSSNSLISAGIVQYWHRYFLDFDNKAMEDPPSEPQVFGLGDLSFGFIVWLIACAITFLVFVAEVLYVKTLKLIKIIKEFMAVVYILTFLERKLFL